MQAFTCPACYRNSEKEEVYAAWSNQRKLSRRETLKWTLRNEKYLERKTEEKGKCHRW